MSEHGAVNVPRATYRLQFRKEFGFDDAAALAPYLARLGISHVYASPYLKARPGSTHGYDIVDHHQLNPELGDEAAFRRDDRGAAQPSPRAGAGFRAEPHGRRRIATTRCGSTCSNGGRTRSTPAGSTSTGTRTGATCRTSCWCRFSATNTGSSWSAASLRLKFDAELGAFAVWAYDIHKLPICPLRLRPHPRRPASRARTAGRLVRRPAGVAAAGRAARRRSEGRTRRAGARP